MGREGAPEKQLVVVDPGRAHLHSYGVEIYNQNLLEVLAQIKPVDIEIERLLLADPAATLPGWHVPSAELKARRIPLVRRLIQLTGGLARGLAELPVIGRRGLYHALVAEEVLPVDASRRIVSIHDLSIFKPELELATDASLVERTREAIKGAAAVVVVSAFSRNELIALANVHPDRVAVVPGAVDHARFYPRPDAEVSTIRERYGLERPYVVSVIGAAVERKRLADVEAVADRVWREKRIEVLILGTGRSARPGARRMGYLPREHLPALYTGAVAMISMSEYEGFGLAPLEACACGTPVVAAQAEGLAETLGEAAIFVEIGDVEGAAAGVLKAAEKRARKQISRRAIARAQAFRWEETGQRMLDVYRAVFRGDSPATAAGV